MKIHKEGYMIIGIAFFFLVLLNVVFYFITSCMYTNLLILIFSLIFFISFLSFFRSPYRVFNGNTKHIIISPADGRIIAIKEVLENDYFKEERIQISIFMGIGNVHVNWVPMNGKIIYYSHRNGRYRAAYLNKSSIENERSTVVIENKIGDKILVRQVAGAIAKRIVTYMKPFQKCKINDQLGFIKFGSRIDLFLPKKAKILVYPNQKVCGNQSILAQI